MLKGRIWVSTGLLTVFLSGCLPSEEAAAPNYNYVYVQLNDALSKAHLNRIFGQEGIKEGHYHDDGGTLMLMVDLNVIEVDDLEDLIDDITSSCCSPEVLESGPVEDVPNDPNTVGV